MFGKEVNINNFYDKQRRRQYSIGKKFKKVTTTVIIIINHAICSLAVVGHTRP